MPANFYGLRKIMFSMVESDPEKRSKLPDIARAAKK